MPHKYQCKEVPTRSGLCEINATVPANTTMVPAQQHQRGPDPIHDPITGFYEVKRQLIQLIIIQTVDDSLLFTRDLL